MFQEVPCTITVKTSKLKCLLRIGENRYDLWWTRVGGQFSLGPEYGNWTYIGNESVDITGIAISFFTGNNPNHPGFAAPSNIRAVLFGVPERFCELVTPASPLAGEGRIVFSNIGSNLGMDWEMRFPL
jgi:hypothetical protein